MQLGYSEKEELLHLFPVSIIFSKFGIIRNAKTIVLELQGVIEFM